MRALTVGIVAAALLLGCGSEQAPPVTPAEEKHGWPEYVVTISWHVQTDEELQSLAVTSKLELSWTRRASEFGEILAEARAGITEQEYHQVRAAAAALVPDLYEMLCPGAGAMEYVIDWRGDAGSMFAIEDCLDPRVVEMRELMSSLKSKYIDSEERAAF